MFAGTRIWRIVKIAALLCFAALCIVDDASGEPKHLTHVFVELSDSVKRLMRKAQAAQQGQQQRLGSKMLKGLNRKEGNQDEVTSK